MSDPFSQVIEQTVVKRRGRPRRAPPGATKPCQYQVTLEQSRLLKLLAYLTGVSQSAQVRAAVDAYLARPDVVAILEEAGYQPESAEPTDE